MRTKKLILLLLFVLALLGSTATYFVGVNARSDFDPESQDVTVIKAYVCKSSAQAMFINWTQDKDNKIIGQLQITTNTKEGLTTSKHRFNGIIDGNQVSLSFTGSAWTEGGKVYTGKLEGTNTLVLLWPSTNGTIDSLYFDTGNVQDFNNAVQDLNQVQAQMQSDKADETRKQSILNNFSYCT